jgi:hypothetical protein
VLSNYFLFVHSFVNTSYPQHFLAYAFTWWNIRGVRAGGLWSLYIARAQTTRYATFPDAYVEEDIAKPYQHCGMTNDAQTMYCSYFNGPFCSRVRQANAVSEPRATMIVANNPINVPSRANPRQVNAVKPHIIEKYALRNRSKKRSSE